MNWDALGAIGEIVGATAVVISVFYLAVQIRKQTVESRLTATRDVSDKRSGFMKLLVSDEDLSQIWLKVIRDYDSL